MSAAAAALAAGHSGCRNLFFVGKRGRPVVTSGVASGDVTADSAVVWSSTERGARMLVDWDTTDSFRTATRLVGPDAVSRNGFTAKMDLQNLPPDARVFYRVTFENLDDFSMSEPVVGSFKTAPRPETAGPRDVLFAWSGDTAGQGWGIDPARGGMRVYAAMADLRPDFFVHSGDTVYADNPLKPEIELPGGEVWKNVITPAKSKVAETVAEFRGQYAYNLMDAHVRRFNAGVPMLVQWDDHETRNNWYPGQTIDDPAYTVRDADVLATRGRQAFFEYMPIRTSREDPHRVYRSYKHGPLLEVFMLDERSYRGRNSPNRQTSLDRASAFLGPLQLEWLKSALAKSTAVWKVIASDMPISMILRDGRTDYEGWANGDGGGPLGRELEVANLLSFLKTNRVRNTVWITADVHFPANVHYHPDRAKSFKDFDPFWEFVSGPLHAGGFGPNALDPTFGPEYRWNRPPAGAGDGPGHGFAAFGTVRIDAATKTLRVAQHGIDGAELAAQDLTPAD
jgi:alkaline phosphatase D